MKLYHATSKTVLPSILKDAQVPEDHLWQPKAVYLWSSHADATALAQRCWKKRTGCVVTVDLPNSAVIHDQLCRFLRTDRKVQEKSVEDGIKQESTFAYLLLKGVIQPMDRGAGLVPGSYHRGRGLNES